MQLAMWCGTAGEAIEHWKANLSVEGEHRPPEDSQEAQPDNAQSQDDDDNGHDEGQHTFDTAGADQGIRSQS